ncbi:MAG: cyclic nucleotide-binding domain-containing protein [Rhodospirillales bacterium]|nr:cyclic nucleotide-binding domain-containing protein [Rhodospirillales bacterium]
MHRIFLHRGQTLYSAGEPSEYAYLVLEGEIARQHNGLTLAASKGAVLGFSALTGQPYAASAHANSDGELLAFTRKELRAVLRSDPDWALAILEGVISLVADLKQALDGPPPTVADTGAPAIP